MNFNICKKCEHFQAIPNKRDYLRLRCMKHLNFHKRTTIGHFTFPAGFKNSLPLEYNVLIRDGDPEGESDRINDLPKSFWQDWATMCKNLNEKDVQLSGKFQMPTDCPYKLEQMLWNQKL